MQALLIYFLTYFLSAHGSLTPMKIAVVSGYGSLEPEMQSQLQNSLNWFQSAFLVHKSSHPVQISDIYERIPEYQKFSSVLVQTPLHRQNIRIKGLKSLLEISDFTVFIVAQDPRRCAREPDLLAEALPIVLLPDTRFYYDLFRHETLHGLGYGLIVDKTGLTDKPSEKMTWHGANGVGHPENRHFLDFDNFALKAGKEHFGCSNMKGIPADGERKNHLNEYVFGNELMTTHLEPSGNIFSWISVGIIERTYNGDQQWYHINRTYITPEADQYSYGRNFGCVFLEKSCHEFIRFTEATKPNFKTAPFCSRNHKNVNLRYFYYFPIFHEFQMCYKLPNSQKLYKISDKGCEMRRVIGGTDNGGQQRECPIIKHLPPMYEIVQCPPPPGG
ncbi:hypothetical protein GCK72_008085 [Caenorhabditis remanei]|uniref:Uncharacterized protein n=1 Tax=Caenorhabditis remanei TaxID=31234 RepID=A0A6A5HP64_CAERE|nr:hypothetical protein GCK72_008085 [Caenorhabditis remanei]KAF1768123.1 hypothetical protein GCK72_008085 [Caenorhabditis remanei]